MNQLLIKFIIKYKQNISPIIKPGCRFIPTCSEYAILSLKKYNVFKALVLIFIRILKCNPLTHKNVIDFP